MCLLNFIILWTFFLINRNLWVFVNKHQIETCRKNWFPYLIAGWNLPRLDRLKFHPGKTASCNHDQKHSIDVRLISNEKDHLKWTSKSSYMLQKIFVNYFVAIHKSKVTLTLNKPRYVRMCILHLSMPLDLCMSSTMITLKIYMVTNQDHNSMILIV